jgi:hypothetical protein
LFLEEAVEFARKNQQNKLFLPKKVQEFINQIQ